MPRPPMNRKTINEGQFHASAHPTADNDIEHSRQSQRLAPPSFCPMTPAPECAYYRAYERDGDCPSLWSALRP